MEKTKEKLSGPMLYQIGHKTETHANVSLALATRQRIRDFSNLASLEYELRHAGFKIVHEDYMAFWKDWQEAKLGQLILGRNKKKTRFLHFYDMRKIAEAMLEGKDVEIEMRKKEDHAVAMEMRAGQLDSIAKSINDSIVRATPAAMETLNKIEKARTVTRARAAAKVVGGVGIKNGAKPSKSAELAKTLFNRVLVALRPGVFVDLVVPQDATPGEIDLIREALNRIAPAGAYKAA